MSSASGLRNQKFAIVMLSCTVFFGATLLFIMEPLVGRMLTPYFGGTAHVWLLCLMFFQAMLFLGYLYTHLLVRKLGAWHFLFLLLPLVNLPLRTGGNADPNAPVLAVLSTLILHVALPFIALSTTAVVMQTWLANSTVGQNKEPYPLYAASNAGSLLALLGYAFLIEPLSGLKLQSFVWSGGYLAYILLVLAVWFRLRPGRQSTNNSGHGNENIVNQRPNLTVYSQWLLLSALPSAFLLAITNYISLEVGSFPFVWVIPLSLYLGSFILAFRARRGGVPRFLGIFWPEVLLLAASIYLLSSAHMLVFIGNLSIFFIICIIAHGRLYELRPPTRYLTDFYLVLALGGWIGGIFVSLVAPFIFRGLFEYPILLLLLGVIFWWVRHDFFIAFWHRATRLVAWSRMLFLGAVVGFILLGSWAAMTAPIKFQHRNFYGTYRIIDTPPVRKLVHGKTLHGSQLLDLSSRLTPISYYYEGGPISEVYGLVPSPRHMAVIGLGAGVISAYARRDDSLTFYEIDPDNEKIARKWFTYLNESKTNVKVVVGDGRISMMNGKNEVKYDLILVDAFTGDGIPTHLLTKEAIFVYLDQLSETGILLFHVSNRYYDLRPVLKSTITSLGVPGVMNVRTMQKQGDRYSIQGQCVAVSIDPERLQPLINRGWLPFGKGDGLRDMKPWTDDYINILAPLAKATRSKWLMKF